MGRRRCTVRDGFLELKIRSDSDVSPGPGASTPAPGPAARDYDDADLEAAFAYLDLLIHGDPFSTGPAPPRFNELCASSSEFAARVKAHADDSRRRASDDEDPVGDLG